MDFQIVLGDSGVVYASLLRIRIVIEVSIGEDVARDWGIIVQDLFLAVKIIGDSFAKNGENQSQLFISWAFHKNGSEADKFLVVDRRIKPLTILDNIKKLVA